MKSKKARRTRLFQDLQKNSPPKRKAYFVLKFVPLDKEITKKQLDKEIVIAGMLKRDKISYHANLMEAAKDELRKTNTIQRQYGYILDLKQIRVSVK